MPRIHLRAAVLLAMAAGSLFGFASASSAEEGRLIARAAGSVPGKSTIAVRASEADDRTAALVQAISRALEGQGYHVSDEAGLILEFRIEEPIFPVQKPTSRLSLEGKGGSGERTETEVLAEITIGRERESPPRTNPELRIELFLFAPKRAPIWSATVAAPRSGQDEDRQLARMVKAAMSAFGKTEDRRFDVLE